MTHDRMRRGLSAVFVAACAAAVLLALVPLAFILFFVIKQGVQALNLELFTHMPKPAGEAGGGMRNAFVGTLIMTGLASLFAVPIGILSGVYMSEYKGTRLALVVRVREAVELVGAQLLELAHEPLELRLGREVADERAFEIHVGRTDRAQRRGAAVRQRPVLVDPGRRSGAHAAA